VDYGIPTVETHVAVDVDEAVARAEAMGYPVVLKLHSYTITHKTDVGGVKLNLRDAEAVQRAYEDIRAGVADTPGAFSGVTVQPMVRLEGYELILGSSPDAQFGPVLLFGSGGQLVEVYRDRALGLPPQTTTLARRMIERTRIHKALLGVRGRPPVDMDALEGICVRFSQLVVEQPQIREIEINPLIASPAGMLALDARVTVYDSDTPDSALPRPAIRPYPRRYASPFNLRTGEQVMIRPIRPEDEPLLVAFHEALSEESVYLRYAGTLHLERRVAHERLARLCFIDYDREMALVAVRGTDAGAEMLGVGRLTRLHGTEDAEFALLVRDDAQGQGLGTELLRRLVDIGRREGVARIVGDVLGENRGMQSVARELGFRIVQQPGDDMVKVVLDIN
jgi:acetyltransferase